MSKRHHHQHSPPPKLSVTPHTEPTEQAGEPKPGPKRWVVVTGGSFPVEGGGRARVIAGKIISNPEYAELLRSRGIEVKECD